MNITTFENRPNRTVIEHDSLTSGSISSSKGNITRIEFYPDGSNLSIATQPTLQYTSTNGSSSKLTVEVNSKIEAIIGFGSNTTIQPAIVGIKGDKGDPGTGGGGASTLISEEIIVSQQIINDKSFNLAHEPKSAISIDLTIYGGINQRPNHDFLVQGSTISWDMLALEMLIDLGTVISIRYEKL